MLETREEIQNLWQTAEVFDDFEVICVQCIFSIHKRVRW